MLGIRIPIASKNADTSLEYLWLPNTLGTVQGIFRIVFSNTSAMGNRKKTKGYE